MNLIDTHCHLYDEPLAEGLGEVLSRARAAGVEAMVVVGTTLETSRRAVDLALAHVDVWAAVGLHPDAAEPLDTDALDALIATAPDRVVAVGEIGLDGSRGKERLAAQEPVFRAQLALARDHDLPVLIHSRDATGHVVRILGEVGPGGAGGPSGPGGSGGILHAFAGSREVATELIGLGYVLGVAGVACRPQATRIRGVLGALPLSSLVLETDAPYIGTATHRPGEVEPAQVREVCHALAELHGVDPDIVAATTTATARKILRLPPTDN
jgi:TatD DNase family protein